MRCPYNFKSETVLEIWKNSLDDEQIQIGSTTTKRIEYEYMECGEENRAAWYDGRCNYKA